VHTHEFSMNVFGGAAAWCARVPSLTTIHGRAWVADRPRRVLAYRALRRLGSPLLAVSHDLAGYLAERFRLPREAIGVVHNGIPLAERVPPAERPARRKAAREAAGLPAEGALLLCVGNLYPVKDHATLVRGLPRLPADARVAIAGRGEEEARLRALATELGVADRLHLLGLRDDVDRLLTAADVFVQPSRHEGLPLAVLEAMGHGLPVVASRVGGLPEAVEDGVSGLLVPPGDPEALARALAGLLAAPERVDALADAARTRAEAEFSVAAMTDRYRALYHGLTQARRARP